MSESNSPIPVSTIEYFRPLPPPEGPRPRDNYWLHALLLALTIFTTLVVGAKMEFNFLNNLPAFDFQNERIPLFPIEWALQQPSRLLLGIPFSFTLLLILLSHEMGHYLFCRYYKVRATLPFFIPAPTLIGTFGAVIRIKAPIRSRAALFDIGIAGPIAGFLVAVSTLILALLFSKPLSPNIPPANLEFGFPLIFYWIHAALRVVVPGYAVAGLPLARVYMHPMAVAAWVGMYATALNLLPSGQLDGGHIVYALLPRIHRLVSWSTVAGLLVLGWFNYAWWFWGALITGMNILTYRQRQAPEFPPLPRNRLILALAGLVMLVLTFTVVPIRAN